MRGLHASWEGAVIGILSQQRLKGRPWDSGGAGENGVYVRGFLEGSENKWNRLEYERVLSMTADSTKNCSGIVIEGTVEGILVSIKSGGITAEQATVNLNTFTHVKGDKRWCVCPERFRITAVIMTFAPEGISTSSDYLGRK